VFCRRVVASKKTGCAKTKSHQFKNAAISASRRNFAYDYYAYQCIFLFNETAFFAQALYFLQAYRTTLHHMRVKVQF
jgi:hypothetical protein